MRVRSTILGERRAQGTLAHAYQGSEANAARSPLREGFRHSPPGAGGWSSPRGPVTGVIGSGVRSLITLSHLGAMGSCGGVRGRSRLERPLSVEAGECCAPRAWRLASRGAGGGPRVPGWQSPTVRWALRSQQRAQLSRHPVSFFDENRTSPTPAHPKSLNVYSSDILRSLFLCSRGWVSFIVYPLFKIIQTFTFIFF